MRKIGSRYVKGERVPEGVYIFFMQIRFESCPCIHMFFLERVHHRLYDVGASRLIDDSGFRNVQWLLIYEIPMVSESCYQEV